MTAARDPEHIAEVCRLAMLAIPRATHDSARAFTYRADDTGTTLVIGTANARRAVRRALRLHGYRVAEAPEPASCGVIVSVTGWSPERLAKRVTALRRVVGGLERALPTTIATAAAAYAHLHGSVEDPRIALYGLADALRADAESRAARHVGPLPRIRISPQLTPHDLRALVSEANELTRQAIDLLTLHWHATVRTAERFAELAHRRATPTARAQAATEIRRAMLQERKVAWFLAACQWADDHLDSADTTPFANWYVAEYGPPRWLVAPFDAAARRWHAVRAPTEPAAPQGAAPRRAPDPASIVPIPTTPQPTGGSR